MRKIGAIAMLFLVILFCSSGCAGLGVWSEAAQAEITKIVAFYNQYLAGALSEAPAVLAEAGSLLGAESPIVSDATAGLSALKSTVAALNTVAQAGTSTNTAQANVQAAITAFNQAYGAVEQAIGAASGGK